MSVATMLGVDDVEAPPMLEARDSWASWTVLEPALSVVDDLLDLPAWTRAVDSEPKDAAMRSLVKLGSDTGGADPVATTALTWALVPGAAVVACRLSDLSANIDELVASHLWTSAKTFAWECRRVTAAAILRDTRRGVLIDLGVGELARRRDKTWSQTVCVEPTSPAWRHYVSDQNHNSVLDLLDLLEEAVHAGVVTAADRALLVDLAIAADRACAPAGRGRAGLTGPAVEVVAGQQGMAPRSVRRRAAKSIDRLAAFSSEFLEKDHAAVAPHADFVALGA